MSGLVLKKAMFNENSVLEEEISHSREIINSIPIARIAKAKALSREVDRRRFAALAPSCAPKTIPITIGIA